MRCGPMAGISSNGAWGRAQYGSTRALPPWRASRRAVLASAQPRRRVPRGGQRRGARSRRYAQRADQIPSKRVAQPSPTFRAHFPYQYPHPVARRSRLCPSPVAPGKRSEARSPRTGPLAHAPLGLQTASLAGADTQSLTFGKDQFSTLLALSSHTRRSTLQPLPRYGLAAAEYARGTRGCRRCRGKGATILRRCRIL